MKTIKRTLKKLTATLLIILTVIACRDEAALKDANNNGCLEPTVPTTITMLTATIVLPTYNEPSTRVEGTTEETENGGMQDCYKWREGDDLILVEMISSYAFSGNNCRYKYDPTVKGGAFILSDPGLKGISLDRYYVPLHTRSNNLILPKERDNIISYPLPEWTQTKNAVAASGNPVPQEFADILLFVGKPVKFVEENDAQPTIELQHMLSQVHLELRAETDKEAGEPITEAFLTADKPDVYATTLAIGTNGRVDETKTTWSNVTSKVKVDDEKAVLSLTEPYTVRLVTRQKSLSEATVMARATNESSSFLTEMYPENNRTMEAGKIYTTKQAVVKAIRPKTYREDQEERFLVRLWQDYPWVGTFHRASEVGERIIHAAHTGEWTAEVDDPKGTGKFVVLSTNGSADPGMKTDNPGNAEEYPVISRLKNVSGTGYIFFRIGWTEALSDKKPDTTTPPRYATITLKWSDGGTMNKTSTLYLRQGEAADYVYRPEDVFPVGTTPASLVGQSRLYAAKILPYNSRGNKGECTDFPTKGGNIYHFGNNSEVFSLSKGLGYPLGTARFDNINKKNWLGYDPNNANADRVCPKGYRVMNEGLEAHGGNTTTSDVRHSLFLCPKEGGNQIIQQEGVDRLDGFYADGYFERHPLKHAAGRYFVQYATVNPHIDGKEAFGGQLSINSVTKASVFVPGTGWIPFYPPQDFPGKDPMNLEFSGYFKMRFLTATYTLESNSCYGIDGGIEDGNNSQEVTKGYKRRPVRCVSETSTTSSTNK